MTGGHISSSVIIHAAIKHEKEAFLFSSISLHSPRHFWRNLSHFGAIISLSHFT